MNGDLVEGSTPAVVISDKSVVEVNSDVIGTLRTSSMSLRFLEIQFKLDRAWES